MCVCDRVTRITICLTSQLIVVMFSFLSHLVLLCPSDKISSFIWASSSLLYFTLLYSTLLCFIWIQLFILIFFPAGSEHSSAFTTSDMRRDKRKLYGVKEKCVSGEFKGKGERESIGTRWTESSNEKNSKFHFFLKCFLGDSLS